MREPGIHQIGADTLNLSDDVVFSSKSHRDHEHGAAAAYDDAEHRQSRAEFVRPERLKRKMSGLAPIFGFGSYV